MPDVLVDRARDGVVDDRDRELDPVDAGESGGVVVLRVLAHGEDGSLRLADPLALEEVRVEAGGLVDPGAGSSSAIRRARSRFGSISRTPIRCSSSCRAIAVPTCPPPKTTTSSTTPSPRRQQLAPGVRGLRRADHDEPVAGRDDGVAARDHHRVRRG